MKVGRVGSGPTALFISLELVSQNIEVTMFDKKSSPSRKLLLASQSGLNLTTDREDFSSEYNSPIFKSLIEDFNQNQLKLRIEKLGLHTFKGNGNKIFLKETGEQLIKVCFDKLQDSKKDGSKLFELKLEHDLTEWKGNQLLFSTGGTQSSYSFDRTIFCLGGASWPLTGSDGEWLSLFRAKSILCEDFQPSNCRFKKEWSTQFNPDFIPLKNIRLHYEDKLNNKSKRGDLMLTPDGAEGSPLYYFSSDLRESISENNIKNRSGVTHLKIDLLPDKTEEQLLQIWNSGRQSDSITNKLRKRLNLDKTKIALFNELCSRPLSTDSKLIVNELKNLKLEFSAIGDISDAISSSGGVDLSELDSNLELKKTPGFYCGGEMVNWDAPTGGYLIHGCLAMGRRISHSILSGKPIVSN